MTTRDFTATIMKVAGQEVRIPIGVTLVYDADVDPFAVLAIFKVSGEEDKVWHIGRDLLAAGSRSPITHGKGDVKLRYFYMQDIVMMCLRGADGHADVAFKPDDLWSFIDDTAEESKAAGDCTAMIDDFLREVFEA